MSAMSDYLELKVLDHVLGTSAYTMPTTVYVGLSTGSFADDNSGTELTGNGYAREAVTFAAATSPGGTTSNSGAVTFTASGGNWGSITHIGIHDALSGGNLLWHGAMTAAKTVNDGDTLEFSIGNIDLTIA